LTALLGFIIDSELTSGEKGLKCGVLPTEVMQQGALGYEKAAEGRIVT